MISARLRLLGVIALGACASDGTGAGEVLVVAQIDIQPPGAGLVVGGTQQLTAIPKTNSGISVPGRQVTWYTSDERIATVSGTGLVTAVALGQANITARVDQITASVPVNVSPKPVATIELQPPTAELLVGHSVQLVVTMRGADGDVLTDRPATFLSDNPAIASVSTTGAVVAVAVGQTVVRARSEGKEGTSTITVAARPAARLGFTTQPSNATAGQAFGPVRVAVQDEIGGTVTGATNQVTLELSDNPGNATLTGPLTVTAVTGIATFANLVLNKAGTGYTLRATSGSLSPAISSPFSITAGPATTLGITTQPPGSAQSGVPLTQPPVVQVQDDHGNPVGQAGVQITAVMVGAGATLSGTTTATTNPTGTATFTGLVISGAAGTYQLRFTATGFTPAVSSDILLSSSALSIVTQPPTNATNGALLSQQPVVRIVDGAGMPVPQGGVIVSVALTGTGGVLSGALSVNTDGAGVASFSGLTITGTAGAFRLVFSAPGVASVTSAPIALGAGAAAQVRVAVQPPASAQSGTPLAPQPEIQVADQSGNPVSTAGISVAASLASGTGTLGGTLTIPTNASGRAVFTNLAITGPSGSFTLRFTTAALGSVVTDPVTLGAGSATQLSIAIQPANTAQSGAALAPQPAIQLRDGANNPVALAGVTITAGIASGGGTLLGTTTAVTNGSGLATFSGLAISGTVGNRTLQFTAPGLTPVTSNTIAITPGAAAKLALTAQPSPTASSGTPFVQQPVVQIQDAAGNSVAQSTTAITAAIETGAGGSLGGGLIALTNAAGQASYTNLALTGASGDYTLRFTSGTLTAVVSNTIALGAGAGSKLSLSQQPSPSAKNGQNFPQQPVAQLLDASDNPVAQAGVQIAVTILSGGGTLSGTRPIPTNGAGQAAFTDLAITGTVGDRTLIFAATGYSSVTSNTISLTAGDPAALEITTQPSGSAQSGVPLAQQPVIHLEDVSGNAVSQAGIVVTATLASGTGTLTNASATTDGSGVATFSSLTITGTVGSKTLGFSAASLTGTTSGIVNLASGAATRLTITTQPGGAASGQSLTPQPQVQLRDGAGNPVSQVGVIVTAAIATAPGGSPTLTNPTATTDANGLATFSGLTITGPVGSYTLQFSSGSLTPTTSGAVIVGAGTPSQLTITSVPSSNAQSGSALASQPLIQVRDAGGNAVGQAGLTVTAVIASGPGGSLGNASAITDGTGLATFTGLTITGPVGGYTLRFESGALTPATSGTITLAAGAPALITIEVQPPSNAQSGQAFTADPRVRVLDAGSNPLAAVSVTVALGTGAGNGTLNGTLAQSTDADGRVTFAGLSISGLIGNYTLGFAAGAASATSTGITLSAGTAAKLSIQTQPSPTARNDQEIAIQPVIQVEDAGGNPVTTSGLTVNAAIVSGGGTLSGTSATTNGSGQASFTGMKITGTIGTRTIQFSSGSLAVATSNGVTVTAGTATKILIVTNPPTSISSGSTLSPNPVVDLRDVSDNDVDSSGVEVTVGLASGAGTLSGTLVRTTGASGQAVFDDLVISGVPGDRTLGFSGSGLAGATSNTITVTAAAPAQLVITVSPSNTARSSIPLATAPEVQVLDGSSVPVSGVTVNASLDQAGSLSGSASGVSDIDGKVVFTGLTITGPVGNKTISFSANGLPTTTTSVIALSAGPATQLGITTQPGSPAINGELFSTQPVLQLLDGAGNSVDSSGASVDVAILAGTGVLAGVATAVTGANGSAAFVDLAITGSTASPFTLQFTATGLTSATSNNIILQAGAATQLTIKTQPPASAVTAVTLSTPPEVELRDGGGNLVATNGVEVTAVLETISGAGVITPGSTNPVSTVGGVASFGSLSITGAGTFTLRFDAPGVSSATSIVITVTP